jgi:hypothetical protein
MGRRVNVDQFKHRDAASRSRSRDETAAERAPAGMGPTATMASAGANWTKPELEEIGGTAGRGRGIGKRWRPRKKRLGHGRNRAGAG